MSNYRKNAASNRDALFGGLAEGSSAGRKPSRSTTAASSQPSAAAAAASRPASNKGPQSNKGYTRKTNSAISKLSGEARAKKLKEAQEYKEKANKCMEKGFMKTPDPVAATTFFKRAADCYQQAGEVRLERLYRIESANCNRLCGAWATAANDYTRAAELMMVSDDYDESNLRKEASLLHKKAAASWTEVNEKGKAAASQVAAALVLYDGDSTAKLNQESLIAIEEAVEAHVPDPLNPYARYRQTGHSAFLDPDTEETIENFSSATKELAQEHLVNRAYAHEPVQNVVNLLTSLGEYPSALYAAGAASVLLSDGMSTISLARAFCVETILTLAMGDPVLAERQFLDRHVQKDFYLKSRECQLSEELIKAIKLRNVDGLEEARSTTGPNRAALANLPHDSLRKLVQNLRIAGVAREAKAKASTAVDESKPLKDVLMQKTGYEVDETLDGADLEAELDDLDLSGNDLDDSTDQGDEDDDLAALNDDDIDLR